VGRLDEARLPPRVSGRVGASRGIEAPGGLREAIAVELHVLGGVFTRGERVFTISDPGGRGIPGAVCLTSRSEEGSLWTAELFPILGPDLEHMPPTKSIQSVTCR